MMDILIVCGGTGGHLSPGIAVAEELMRKGHHCRLMISQKQVDSALVQKYPHLDFIKVPGRAFSGGFIARIRSLIALLQSFFMRERSSKLHSLVWYYCLVVFYPLALA